jgi:beta-lactamase class A
MTHHLTRRGAAVLGLGTAASLATGLGIASPGGVLAAAAAVEQRLGARVGVSVLDTATGHRLAHRADERFPLNSTFKAFAAAALLSRVDAGQERLDRRVVFGARDLVDYSPATEGRTGEPGMTLEALCVAITRLSDNTAANLILDALGGPEGVTRFMRGIGDATTRLDRRETALNEGRPGDPRDTSTPEAAAASLHTLLFGPVLSPASRARLEGWMEGNAVADVLFRARLPAGWRIADRTGAGGFGSRSIIAAIWPPGRAPVVAAVYLTGTAATMAARNEAIAEIGEALFRGIVA